jgi:hypothetical protein
LPRGHPIDPDRPLVAFVSAPCRAHKGRHRWRDSSKGNHPRAAGR